MLWSLSVMPQTCRYTTHVMMHEMQQLINLYMCANKNSTLRGAKKSLTFISDVWFSRLHAMGISQWMCWYVWLALEKIDMITAWSWCIQRLEGFQRCLCGYWMKVPFATKLILQKAKGYLTGWYHDFPTLVLNSTTVYVLQDFGLSNLKVWRGLSFQQLTFPSQLVL